MKVDLITLANQERNTRKNIEINLTQLVRFAAIAQSGGLGLTKTDLRALVGCDTKALNILLSIRHILADGFEEGQSASLEGSVVCGGCRATVYRLPCIKCGHGTWISKVVSHTRHKEQPGTEPVDTYSPQVFKVPTTGRRRDH